MLTDRQSFSGSGLTETLKGQYTSYASIWHYGESDRSFRGTIRTLDEADGAIPLEQGLTSRQGYAVPDDSQSMETRGLKGAERTGAKGQP